MRTTEWHEERKKYLGASEVATILGANPYSSPWEVWAVKKGLIEPFGGNEVTKLGQRIEPVLLDYAEDDLGELDRDVPVPHPSVPLRATLDGQVKASGDVVEAKTAGLLSGRADDWGEDGLVLYPDQIPKTYYLQVQTQLACTGEKRAHLYAMLPRRGVTVYEVKADPKLQGAIVRHVDDWWNRYMIGTEEPDIRSASLDALKRLDRDPSKEIYFDEDAESLVMEYQNAKRHAAIHKRRMDSLQREIIASLGDAERAVTPRGYELRYDLQDRKQYTVKAASYRVLRIKESNDE